MRNWSIDPDDHNHYLERSDVFPQGVITNGPNYQLEPLAGYFRLIIGELYFGRDVVGCVNIRRI
jgi:hypothetical protein